MVMFRLSVCWSVGLPVGLSYCRVVWPSVGFVWESGGLSVQMLVDPSVSLFESACEKMKDSWIRL